MPSCRAASILAWPAISPPSSPTSAGVVQPHSLMLAAIAAIWASVWVRAFLAYGISRSIAHRQPTGAERRLADLTVFDFRSRLARGRAEGGEVPQPKGQPAICTYHHRDLGDAELPGGE